MTAAFDVTLEEPAMCEISPYGWKDREPHSNPLGRANASATRTCETPHRKTGNA